MYYVPISKKVEKEDPLRIIFTFECKGNIFNLLRCSCSEQSLPRMNLVALHWTCSKWLMFWYGHLIPNETSAIWNRFNAGLQDSFLVRIIWSTSALVN